MSQKLVVVTRKLQMGASVDTFDWEKFVLGAVGPFQSILKSDDVDHMVVETCGEGPYAEVMVNGKTPTMLALEGFFKDEIESGRLIPRVCMDWGRNAGSATALNDGLKIARDLGAELVMNWSPEFGVTPEHIILALSHMKQHHLDVCGMLRMRWWSKPQWIVPQNTGAIWNVEMLKIGDMDGFSRVCNGDGKTTVKIDAFGEVPLAGMEDFEAILRLFSSAYEKGKELPRLGMICRSDPIFWDLTLKKPGTPEYDDQLKKVLRQFEVMKAYAARISPGKHFDVIFEEIMMRTWIQ
jgi:hypothetical protein